MEGLIQAPNISKHISRNRGATIKASRKTIHDKVFFILGQKFIFCTKKIQHHQKKVVTLNMYIGTNGLVYGRWLVLKVQVQGPAGPTLSPFHRLTLLMPCESKSMSLKKKSMSFKKSFHKTLVGLMKG